MSLRSFEAPPTAPPIVESIHLSQRYTAYIIGNAPASSLRLAQLTDEIRRFFAEVFPACLVTTQKSASELVIILLLPERPSISKLSRRHNEFLKLHGGFEAENLWGRYSFTARRNLR